MAYTAFNIDDEDIPPQQPSYRELLLRAYGLTEEQAVAILNREDCIK